MIDGCAEIILKEALSVTIQEVAREALHTVIVGTKLLAISITVRCWLALAVALVELITLVAARTKAV